MSKKETNPSINFIIHLEVYPFDVMVSIGQNDQELGLSLDKYPLTLQDIENCRYPTSNSTGRALMFSTNASLLRLPKIPKTATEFGSLAHEIFHIVTFVLDNIGMKLVIMKSDEGYAYLISYLTRKIYKKLNKYY